MNSRIKKLQEQLAVRKIDGLLVTDDINVSYLSRINASESWLLVTPNKTFYITDFRYIHEVRKSLRRIQAIQYAVSIFDTVFELAAKHSVKTLGYDECHWTLSRFKGLKQRCPKSVKLVAANQLVESLREIKETTELNLVRAGLDIHQQALKYIKKFIKPGVSEVEILKRLEGFTRLRDVGFSFPPIVASGPNSSYPHAHVSPRKIKNNEPVLLDMGVDFKGYKTDLTRMFFLGKISNLVKDARDHVAEAQRRAIECIRDGVEIAVVDEAARNYLKSKKLDKYFGHALGHGVGLEIHEGPKLHHTVRRPLRAGMLVTIEPAVYFPHKFGIRLEEMVLVKKKGYEVISGHIN